MAMKRSDTLFSVRIFSQRAKIDSFFASVKEIDKLSVSSKKKKNYKVLDGTNMDLLWFIVNPSDSKV